LFDVYKIQDQVPAGLKDEQPHHKVTTTNNMLCLWIHEGPKIICPCVAYIHLFVMSYSMHV